MRSSATWMRRRALKAFGLMGFGLMGFGVIGFGVMGFDLCEFVVKGFGRKDTASGLQSPRRFGEC